MPETLPFDPTAPKELPKPAKRKGFSARDVASVFIKFEARCAKCAVKVQLGGYDIDHIVRIDAGGKHELGNWQLLCVPCHKPKTTTDNAQAKKGRRIRGEAGQVKRRRERGHSSIKAPPVSALSKDARGYVKRKILSRGWGK